MKKVAPARVWPRALLAAIVLGCGVAARAQAETAQVPSEKEVEAAERAFLEMGSCKAAGLKAPPERFRVRDTGRMLAGSLPISVYHPEGYVPRLAGVIRLNVPGECTGLYLWDKRTEAFLEVGNSTVFHRPPLLVERAVAEENTTVLGLKRYLSAVAVRRNQVEEMRREAPAQWEREVAQEKREPAATATMGSAADAAAVARGWEGARQPAIAEAPAQEASVRYHEPEPAPPAPTPRPVIQTVYRDVPIETPSRLMQLVESRLGWLLCGGIVLGVLVGLAMRGSRSGQIVISPEEHARAAAQLEERLRADALRIRSLSNAVDLEEARYIQRVSAITRRS